MSKVIQLDLGEVEYEINGFPVKFNPTDIGFVKRVFSTFDAMDKISDEYTELVKKLGDDSNEVEAFCDTTENKMRELINDVFGEDICSPIFGRRSVFGKSNGFPIWVNLMLVLIDEMDSAFAREQKLANPRIKKYTAKLDKKAKK